jgi:hypothetical protein
MWQRVFVRRREVVNVEVLAWRRTVLALPTAQPVAFRQMLGQPRVPTCHNTEDMRLRCECTVQTSALSKDSAGSRTVEAADVHRIRALDDWVGRNESSAQSKRGAWCRVWLLYVAAWTQALAALSRHWGGHWTSLSSARSAGGTGAPEGRNN